MTSDIRVRFLWTLCLSVLCLESLGCSSRGYDGAQRFPLSGQVTYDGKPIDWGSISFIPMGGDAQRVSGGVIKEGNYTVPEDMGANAGKYRVQISWLKLTGKKIRSPGTEDLIDERLEALPARFHKSSEITVDVSADHTTFDFDLKSKE